VRERELVTIDVTAALQSEDGKAPVPCDRVDVLGCRIDRLDMAGTVARCMAAVQTRSFASHMSVNVAKLVTLRDDPELRRAVDGCDIVNADGLGIVWASRLLGDPLPERVAGIDLMYCLLAEAEQHGYSVYILGAKSEVLEQAVHRLREEHPALRFAGWRDGYFSDEEESGVAQAIRDSHADLLFIAMSSPRKEYFLSRHGESMGVPFVMGVGGAIDVVSGIRRRAPQGWQKLGLEWLFRLLQEPRRMLRRYAITNARFLFILTRELALRLLSRMTRGARHGRD
jgi:N-acetylglucosaminyldiphosphoundecaprenol N-acetyl-beta-D-mannosaminyltransferase